VKCEVQIKTLLEEAFDAKSHDLVYKPGKHIPAPRLKAQFATLASALKTIDSQSEFLKDLILDEDRELSLRRNACLEVFLKDEKTVTVAQQLGLELDQPLALVTVVQRLKPTEKVPLSPQFCELAALCALLLNNDYIREVALDFLNQQYGMALEAEPIRRRAYLKWTLGNTKEAIKDTDRALSLAIREQESIEIAKGKNNFVYFVADIKCVEGVQHDEWLAKAWSYLPDLLVDDPYNYKDTVGFFFAIFGQCRDAIIAGWDLLRDSYDASQKDERTERFLRYHEYSALRRLLGITSGEGSVPKIQAI